MVGGWPKKQEGDGRLRPLALALPHTHLKSRTRSRIWEEQVRLWNIALGLALTLYYVYSELNHICKPCDSWANGNAWQCLALGDDNVMPSWVLPTEFELRHTIFATTANSFTNIKLISSKMKIIYPSIPPKYRLVLVVFFTSILARKANSVVTRRYKTHQWQFVKGASASSPTYQLR